MCRYEIDREGRLVAVDDGWRAFALANGAGRYADAASLYGVPLLSFVSESTTRHIYATLMHRVRSEGIVVRVPFRCDAPAVRPGSRSRCRRAATAASSSCRAGCARRHASRSPCARGRRQATS